MCCPSCVSYTSKAELLFCPDLWVAREIRSIEKLDVFSMLPYVFRSAEYV